MKDKPYILHPYYNKPHTLSFFHFPDFEHVILYHISPHIFVHLPTAWIIHYRFLDYKKLDGVIYKKDDLMSFFQEL